MWRAVPEVFEIGWTWPRALMGTPVISCIAVFSSSM